MSGVKNEEEGKTRTKDKYRVVYTDYQRLELEKEFHLSHYITIKRKAELALQLNLTERQVKIWFQNRRAKQRKQMKKQEEQRAREQLRQQTAAQVVTTNVVDTTTGGMAGYAGGEMAGMLGGLMHANVTGGASSSMAMPMQAAPLLPTLPAWMTPSPSTSSAQPPVPPQPLPQPLSQSSTQPSSLSASLHPSEIIALNTVLNPSHSSAP